MKKYLNATTLVDLGYRDYIAARFLLNNEFVIQGLTLASTAVEKYLKAIIELTSKKKEWYNFHLDRIEELQGLLTKNYRDITQDFDPVFLDILVKIYKIRYYDNIKEPILIGFYLNQFIGTLDETIHSLEKLVEDKTPYKRAVENKDPHLYKNNFILNKKDRKEFMEKPDTGFAVRINIGLFAQSETIVKGKNISNKYEGCMSTFTDFQLNWDVTKKVVGGD
jgi:HEPN domain-containing protein